MFMKGIYNIEEQREKFVLPAEVDPHGEVSVAAVRVETVMPQGELDKGDVR